MEKTVIRIAGNIGETLLDNITSRMPANYNVLHEPCGGTLRLSLNKLHKVRNAIDTNNHIVNTHNVVKSNPEKLIAELAKLDSSYNALPDMESKKGFYLDIRNRLNSPKLTTVPLARQAALFICLTKLCFNGLLRTNAKGQLNVPFGKKEKALLCDKKVIRAAHAAMASLNIKHGNFDEVIAVAQADDFVLLHPRPFTGKKSAEAGISKLLTVFTNLDTMNVKAMLVIEDDENIRKLFSDYTIDSFSTRSCISARVSGRGSKSILIITNYSVTSS